MKHDKPIDDIGSWKRTEMQLRDEKALRISELCGLTVSDLDFENRLINVDRQLLRNKEVGYYIETPKTKSGMRHWMV